MISKKPLSIVISALFLMQSSMALAAPEPADKKTKEEKAVEKEKKADQKNADNYETVKEFAQNKYKTDPTFRDQVDSIFENTMREHSLEALRVNISGRSSLVSVHEDTWRRHDALYDNLLVQDHINRIGQRLVPADSEKLFAFRVVPDPTPMARALSTGTIYVSTGLISMLDSEAQLAYVLAHEMAHVQMDHWKEKTMVDLGVDEYNAAQERKIAKIGMIGALAGGALGGAIGKSVAAGMTGAAAGAGAGVIAGMLMNKTVSHVSWDKVQEDQADEMAFKAVLNSTYDVREVPRLFVSLDKASMKDARIQLGFVGQRKRLKQRTEKAEDLINNAMKAEIELKAKKGFVSSSAEHRNLMAELKRDNGILAFYSDMFDMARTNLADAVAIRDNDPAAHYFYAKTLKLVGRTDEDMRMAKESFFKAAKADTRRQNYGSHLHLALLMAREKGIDPKQVEAELDTYVTDYARWNAEQHAMGLYPPNLDSIYEYVALYGGDPNWKPGKPDLADFAKYKELADYAPTAAGETNSLRTISIPQADAPGAAKPAAPPTGQRTIPTALPRKK